MNWFQKAATRFPVFQWHRHTKQAIEELMPGNWKQYYGGGEGYTDIDHAGFIGREVMIKPNSFFYVNVDMNRRTYTAREMDSAYGNKDITFKCYVKATGHNQWPTFGDLLGRS